MQKLSFCLLIFKLTVAIQAASMFKEYYLKKVQLGNEPTYFVNDVLGCEKLCLDTNDSCSMVNVLACNRGYLCQIATGFPYTDEGKTVLLHSAKAKVIIKGGSIMNLTTLPETDCSTSSVYVESSCRNVMDGNINAGHYTEWETDSKTDTAWINITFVDWVSISKIQIWHRCCRADQFRMLRFEFANDYNITEPFECTNNTLWTDCNVSNIYSEHVISPAKRTEWIRIVGYDSCEKNVGRDGFREINLIGALSID